MTQLTPRLKNFLMRNIDSFDSRKFLINILTKALRPAMVLSDPFLDEFINSEEPKPLKLRGSLSSPIQVEVEQTAHPNPLVQFTLETGIPHITERDSVFTLMLQYQNYLNHDEHARAAVDENSMKTRGCTEPEFVRYVMTSKPDVTREIVVLCAENSEKMAVAEVTITKDGLLSEEPTIDVDVLSVDPEVRMMTETDTLTLVPGDLPNVKESVETTVGRLIVNVLFLVIPFGDKFPYWNNPVKIDSGDIINDVVKATINKEVDIHDYKRFLDNVYFIGHFTELCTPCASEKCLTTDPNLKKRREELYKQYEGRLTDPLVIAKIEDELIAMDKAYLKDDVSMRFYIPHGGKAFDLWRKKLYIAVGGIEAFSKDTSKYDFIPRSLEDGMSPADLPKYGNESRKGSYQRGHETRNGGKLTKYIIRAFHDSRIVEDDCGSDAGVSIDFRVYDIKRFIGRYIKLGDEWTEITEANINKIVPGIYTMRSPQYCKCSKGGYCFKCMGRRFSEMDIRQLDMNVVDISTTFMNSAMKNMHGSKLALTEIQSIDSFTL